MAAEPTSERIALEAGMDRQQIVAGPDCKRCGAPRAVSPSREPGELACVICGARTYAKPTASDAVPSLDDIFEGVMARLDLQPRHSARDANPTAASVRRFHENIGPCSIHAPAQRELTVLRQPAGSGKWARIARLGTDRCRRGNR